MPSANVAARVVLQNGGLQRKAKHAAIHGRRPKCAPWQQNDPAPENGVIDEAICFPVCPPGGSGSDGGDDSDDDDDDIEGEDADADD